MDEGSIETVAKAPEARQDLRCPVCAAALDGHSDVSGPDRVFGGSVCFGVEQCASCGLGVTHPRLEGEELAAYYPDDYPSWQVRDTVLGRARSYRASFMARLPPFGELVSRGHGDILDVGCGRGDLLTQFARGGWRACGLDTSPAAAEAVRRAGAEAHVGTIEDAPWAAGTFDVVVMSHSLEHMQDPVGSLVCARKLLKPSGTLVVVVPAWDSWQRRIFGSRWVHMDLPRHLQHFTPRSLADAARRAGFARGRSRRSVTAIGFWVSLQYVLFGRWVVHGAARELFLTTVMLLYPLTWLLGRPFGGDCFYFVAQSPQATP